MTPFQNPSLSRWPAERPPLRSLLFVPGGRPERFDKARDSAADAVIFDLEDSVPEEGKQEARRNIVGAIRRSPSKPGPLAVVRINPASTAHWREDLRAVTRPGLDAILLPKCTEEGEVAAVDRLIARLERERRFGRGKILLFLLIETPGALLHLESLILASRRVALLAFGPEDYSLATGVRASADDRELLFGRSLVVAAAAAYGCLAVDGVHMQYRDIVGLLAETERARRLGYHGKLVVHPIQIEPVHRAFAVSAEELDWARKILDVAEQMAAKGLGAAGHEGQLVDAPVIARARRILAAAETANRSR